MKDFFFTLLSNSSINYFPQNTTSSFTVHLAEKITLNGTWKVGIAEIHYKYNFFNVCFSNTFFSLSLFLFCSGFTRFNDFNLLEIE